MKKIYNNGKFIADKKENYNHFRLAKHELTKWFEQSLLNIALTWELLARQSAFERGGRYYK